MPSDSTRYRTDFGSKNKNVSPAPIVFLSAHDSKIFRLVCFMHIRKMVNNELKNKKWYYFPSRRLAVALSLQGWRKAGATGFFTAGFTLLAHVPDPGESAFSYAECPLPGIRPIRPRIRMIRKRVSNSFGPKCGSLPPATPEPCSR